MLHRWLIGRHAAVQQGLLLLLHEILLRALSRQNAGLHVASRFLECGDELVQVSGFLFQFL
jgi:hypothetical protein